MILRGHTRVDQRFVARNLTSRDSYPFTRPLCSSERYGPDSLIRAEKTGFPPVMAPVSNKTRLFKRSGHVAATLVMVAVTLVGCDDADGDAAALLNEDGARMSLSTLLIDAERQRELGDPSSADLAVVSDVDYWLETVDKELRYAAALESYWTESVREAVNVASAARERARGASGLAREAAAAEARDVLDEVAWNEWTQTLIACVDDRISDDDVAQARDSRSGKDPAWQAQVRRADRLRTGAGEALRELDARRSLQRAFYACEMASQVAGIPLEVGSPPAN